MRFIDENNNVVQIERVDNKISSGFFWALDLDAEDIVLNTLEAIEELTTPSVTIKIGDGKIVAPSSWYILIMSEDTMGVDSVPAWSLSMREYTVATYNDDRHLFSPLFASVCAYSEYDTLCVPSLSRKMMLSVPITQNEWCFLTPSDNYKRFLENKYVGNFL